MTSIKMTTALLIVITSLMVCCNSSDNGDDCTATTWYQDMDGDGLGNPDVSQDACDQPDGYVADDSDTDDTVALVATLHAAFADFDTDNVSAELSGNSVTLITNGRPNHTSPYWSNTHPLFIEPTVTTYNDMAPGNIDNFNGSYSLTISANPTKASSSTPTSLGAIGIAVSGAVIYNDKEGPNVPIDNALPSLDYTAAHTGPQSYHYHLEPKAWSIDDDKLIGVIADGFFLYGRKCNSTNDYPTDLDVSGGHISTTQHTTTAEYHYHIINETYLNEYYILFAGEYQGTPSSIR